MNKSSKKHSDLLSKLTASIKSLRSSAQHFPDEVLEVVNKEIEKLGKGQIPDSVATMSSRVEEPGQKNFIIRFDNLDRRVCVYAQIDETKAKGIMERFCTITQTTPNTLGQTHMIRDSVTNTGVYQTLFTHLSPDISKLQEIEIPGGGRIFSYTQQNYFHIVSIETKHRDIY